MHDSPDVALDDLSLEQKVGQLVHMGIGLGAFETDANWPSVEMRETIQEIEPGAVRIYGNHAATPHVMAEYANTLQEWAEDSDHGIPLIISTDCEFGTVDVIRYEAQAYPTLMGRAATGDSEFAREVSAAMARDMTSVGLNMVHRPVADVNTNPENPVIGVRAAGGDPDTVIEYATATLEGVHDEDQIAVTKHFPGHGDTQLDSHHDLPHVTYDRETLEREHLAPFEALIDAGVDAIMTSHIVVECIDPDRPATLSRPVLTDLLRDDLGFDGIVITDAMMMDAISENYGYGDAAVEAVDAGVDLLLTGYLQPDEIHEIRDAVLDAVESGRLSESRIDESVERILAVKDEYGLADDRYADPVRATEVTGSSSHRDLAREAYERSFSIRGGETLPIDGDRSVLLTGAKNVNSLEPTFSEAFDAVVSYQPDGDDLDALGDGTGSQDGSCLDRFDPLGECADVAVVTTYFFDTLPAGQRRLVEAVAAELPTVVVSLGLPTGHDELPEGVTHVATYLQDRLGNPDPVPETTSEALVDTLQSDVDGDDQLLIR